MVLRVLFISGLILGLATPAQAQDDPVLRARAQRASAQGISEGDLPPVPRGIVEPPPLPPPETHAKDTRQSRRTKGKVQKKKPGSKKAKNSSSKAVARGTSK
jgi:hypothetical protein